MTMLCGDLKGGKHPESDLLDDYACENGKLQAKGVTMSQILLAGK